jgi:hypothetical protein
MARAKQRVRRREDQVVGCGVADRASVKHGFADARTSLTSTYALTLEQADADIHHNRRLLATQRRWPSPLPQAAGRSPAEHQRT